jgi:hypothetical protein
MHATHTHAAFADVLCFFAHKYNSRTPTSSSTSRRTHRPWQAVQAEDPVLARIVVDDRAAGAVHVLAGVALLHGQLRQTTAAQQQEQQQQQQQQR